MNFLAHSFLSGSDKNIIIGNFLADLLNFKEQKALPSHYQEGILLHRKIDTFTDNHSAVRVVTSLLRENHGKYAPVVCDILFDTMLIENWTKYSGIDLQTYADTIYEYIRECEDDIPPNYRNLVTRMKSGNFLLKCGDVEGLQFTLGKMQQKAKFTSNFTKAIDDLANHHSTINEQFNLFFPEIILHTQKQNL